MMTIMLFPPPIRHPCRSYSDILVRLQFLAAPGLLLAKVSRNNRRATAAATTHPVRLLVVPGVPSQRSKPSTLACCNPATSLQSYLKPTQAALSNWAKLFKATAWK